MEPREGRLAQIEAWNRLYLSESRQWRGVNRLDLDIVPKSRVLDVGCGNGKTVAALLQKECVVTGIDVSASAIEHCRDHFADAGNFLEGDATALPFPDSTFDLVLLIHLLEHLDGDARRRSVQEAIRVTAPGGLVFIRAFSRDDLRYGKGERTGEHSFRRGNGISYHYFDRIELEGLFPLESDLDIRVKRDEVKFGSDADFRSRFECLFYRPA